MGKWNKAQPEISQEFLQNEQRRKQMIIEAARRRKEKQKKMQQQEQIQRKRQEEAFTRHKQQKKQAYVRYLRNNMHDKYQQIKKNQKFNQPQAKSVSKWKTKQINDLEGLNLQVPVQSKQRRIQSNRLNQQPNPNKNYDGYAKSKKQSIVSNNKPASSVLNQKRRMLQKQFQKMWEDQNQLQQQMMGSKLIDSLDLDFDTVTRGIQINKQIRVQAQDCKQNQLDKIKDLIGYESILMSIDQRNSHRKMFKNQIQDRAQPKFDQLKNKNKNDSKGNKRQVKPANEGQLLNQLKNKKQGKILNWANQQVQQADDLFSNCSNNTRKGHKTLKQINMQIKKEREEKQKERQTKNMPQTSFNMAKNEGNLGITISDNIPQNINMKKKQNPLEPIPQRKINISRQKLRERSYQRKSISQKVIQRQQKQAKEESRNKIKENLAQLARDRSMQRLKSSRQKEGKTSKQTNFHQNNNSNSSINKVPLNKSRTNSTEVIRNNQTDGFSKQKPTQNNRVNSSNNPNFRLKNQGQAQQNQKSSSKQNKIIEVEVKNNNHSYQTSYSQSVNKHPPIPHYRQNDSITIATQDQVFEVQSFIKNQLLSLNRDQRQLQQQIRQLHLANKDKLKQVQQKYEIKTTYKHSQEIGSKPQDDDEESSNKSYKNLHKKQTEDQLQQSLQRLDDMLLRKEIQQKQKNSRITEQDEFSSSSSFINPLSDPISLHKQVLQLAQNISRFQQQVQVQDGYRFKMMKKKQSKANQKQSNNQQGQNLAQSREVSQIQLTNDKSKQKLNIKKPPILDYSQKNQNPNNFQFQDSIDMAECKIKVNQNLKKMLLDD